MANEAEEEVNIAKAGGVQCFNSEITKQLSTMSKLKRAEKEILTTSDGPQIFVYHFKPINRSGA